MAKDKTRASNKIDEATNNFNAGWSVVHGHPIFRPLMDQADIHRAKDNGVRREAYVIAGSQGTLWVHPARRLEPAQWAYLLGHGLLHLAFGHFRQTMSPEWIAACDCVVARFLHDLKFGQPPDDIFPGFPNFPRVPGGDEAALEARFQADGIPPELRQFGTAAGEPDMVWQAEPRYWFANRIDWKDLFARGLNEAVSDAVLVAGGAQRDEYGKVLKRSPAHTARDWFVSSYPLLGAMAATFEIIFDAEICVREGIGIAAINMRTRTIFINPAAGLSAEECRFVMAHELLHAGLRHDTRQGLRDPYLWNVACDFVINDWLIEMGVGQMPLVGGLHDPQLRGLGAEAIYDIIVKDLRRFRKLRTMNGVGLSDIIKGDTDAWWRSREGTTLDAWYRGALCQGLAYHQQNGRGFLPAGLVEEIRALEMPAIPWQVELARWLDNFFPPLEPRRSFARMSRRQSSTPDIPRPARVFPQELVQDRTFGVVLDTSGSMDRSTLAKALGSIASYSVSRDVRAVRVIACDAAPHDMGYLEPDEIAGRVELRGRGGTVLQPGLDYLESAPDFPGNGPVLIITDGVCDDLHPRRKHAYLMPIAARLPFAARGPIFYME